MKPRSLLERLGKANDSASPLQNIPSQSAVRQPVPPRPDSSPAAPEAIPEKHVPARQIIHAESFGGRRSAIPQEEHNLHALKLRIHRRIVDEMSAQEQVLFQQGGNVREQLQQIISTYVQQELADDSYNLNPSERQHLIDDISDEMLGLGPLEPLLKDDSITEIMVNSAQDVFVEQKGRIQLSDTHFHNDAHLMSIIERIVTPLGRRVDESSPMVDARLSDGSRVNIIIPPLALDGPSITIRKFFKNALSVQDLVKKETLSNEMAEFLEACVKARLNILVSGGTGSGKTTTLNVLSSFIPSSERIVTIEDAAELRLQQRHVVRLESRPANLEGAGAISIRDLVKNSLRMRPDRIIVGEVRAGEALDMLQAMNTGHDGSLTTAHANTPRDALSRLETMVLMAGMDLPLRAIRTQISSAIHLILQQSRLSDGSRKITYISEIQGMEGDTIVLQDLFKYVQDGVNPNGKTIGHFETTGLQPSFLDKFRLHGVELPLTLFKRSSPLKEGW